MEMPLWHEEEARAQKAPVSLDAAPEYYTDLEGNAHHIDDWVPEVLPYNGEVPRLVVDQERVDEVLDTLMEAFNNDEYPYDQPWVMVPHETQNMPETLKRNTTDHANFFFNVCYYMRGGIKSVDAVKRMGKVYDKHPHLFDNKYLVERIKYDSWDEYDNTEKLTEEIVAALSEAGLGFQLTTAKAWVENAQRLVANYDGDARNIFKDVSDYDACVDRIVNDGNGKGFVGFRYKMASMLAYFLMDEELVDPFAFPIPIDVHVMRVSIANEMIKFPDAPHGTNLFNEQTTAALRDVYYDYAVRKGVNPLRLCDAVWLLSGAICSKTPGNRTYEPIHRKFRRGRSTVLLPEIIKPDDLRQQRDFARSCGMCPVKATCTKNMPITPYYVSGALIIRGEKQELPAPPTQGSLFD